MISKSNFELAVPVLQWHLKQRDEIKPLRWKKLDDYSDWSKRGRFISSRRAGYKVELVVPYKLYDGKNTKTEFALKNKVLFHMSKYCINLVELVKTSLKSYKKIKIK